MTAPEVEETRSNYSPRTYYNANPELKKCLDMIATGFFSSDDRGRFWPLIDNLLDNDPYLVLADYNSYIECQEKVAESFADQESWIKMSILNVARMGKFSSDRTINEYASDIWKIKPHPVSIPKYNPLKATDVKIKIP
jgi:starch phosphorylase